MLINMMLPRNHTDIIIEVQPDIAYAQSKADNTYTATPMSIRSSISPTMNMMRIGFDENEVMPSMEKLSILQAGTLTHLPLARDARR